MKNRRQHKYHLIGALGMIVLLALVAFVPVLAGFLQQEYRAVRQNALRQGRTKEVSIEIVLSKSAVSDCYFPKDHELVMNGLRYDVISVCQMGNQVIFMAVLDLKETRICALMSGHFPNSATIGQQSMRFTLPDYLPNPPSWSIVPPTNAMRRSEFKDEEARLLAGFEWMFSPPPEVNFPKV